MTVEDLFCMVLQQTSNPGEGVSNLSNLLFNPNESVLIVLHCVSEIKHGLIKNLNIIAMNSL